MKKTQGSICICIIMALVLMLLISGLLLTEHLVAQWHSNQIVVTSTSEPY